ncbi:NAD(P)-dependent oxidoreductase [Terricaulis sp.]|uniref:NAD(P)-dependent oxidoreductase n=1 Tax=Terricaulis sp. TaxID=2768686 RepID=UPI003783C032
MAERMQKFVSVGQKWPDKRPAAERAADFHEIHAEFIAEKAREQASRCAQCGVPFCQTHCPLQNNIPDWLRLTAEGRLEEAYLASAATNPMPEICGRICPQDRLCEGACVIEQSHHGAVTIGAVEKYLTDTAWREGWVAPLTPRAERRESVGIVGAGPAGLAAAERLRQRGYKVTVYDRHDRIGGLLVYGIPNFKLEKDVVARRAQRLIDGGVKFELNCNVGDTLSFEALRAKHDAVLIATGVYKAKPLNAPSDAVVPALDFLIAANRVGLGDNVAAFASGKLNAKDRRVVVIGGGDTAMDCVRTAQRQGAASVTCLYRRDRANMPGSQREVAHAEEEGVGFDWLAAPKSVRAGKTPGVKAIRMRLGAPDASGRQSPEEAPGSAYDVSGDLIIAALGFDAEDLSGWGISADRWGAIEVGRSFETNLPGVYAAGDIVRGASLVVWAIKEGRDAADAMHAWMQSGARVAAE